MGRGMANTSRAYLSAAMLGLSNPDLPFRGTGASVGSILESQAASVYSGGGGSSITTVPPAQEVAPSQAVQNAAAAIAPIAPSIAVTPTSAVNQPPVVTPSSPVGAATQAAGTAAATTAAAAKSVALNLQQSPATETDVDRAFSEDATYQTSAQKGFLLRERVTGSGRQQASMSTIALTPAQRQLVTRLVGQRLSGGHLTAWNNATNARETRDMAEVNRLWGLGTPQAQQQARDLARQVFNRHVTRFWNAERRDAALRADFTAAGMRWDLTASGAPRYLLPNGEQVGMTLDHNTRLMDDPTRALTGTNLFVVPADENSVTLEDIRNNDPFQR